VVELKSSVSFSQTFCSLVAFFCRHGSTGQNFSTFGGLEIKFIISMSILVHVKWLFTLWIKIPEDTADIQK